MASELRARGIAAAAVIALLMGASTAHAQPTAADKEAARRFMEQGRERLDQKDNKGALAAFKSADDIMHLPSTGLMVANEQVNLGLLIEARETLARVLRSPRAPSEPEGIQRARAAAQELDDSLEQRVPSIRVDVGSASTDPSLSITIDDGPVRPAAVQVRYRLNPGHHVVAAKAGASTARQEIDLREGETKGVVLQLRAAGPVTPPHSDTASSDGGRGPGVITYAAFGVAGAGVVVGTITGLLTLSKKSAAEEGCIDGECPPSTHDDLSSAHTMATISTVSFIVAGVGATVGVISLFTGRSSSRPATAAAGVTPWAGIGTAGLRGSF